MWLAVQLAALFVLVMVPGSDQRQLWLPVSATLTTHTIDETTKTVTLNCNADIVNLPPGLTAIHDVRFYRQVYGNNMPEDLMAHYSPYNRFWKQDLNTFIPAERNWTFTATGAPPLNSIDQNAPELVFDSRAMNIEWNMYDARASDSGLYICKVFYVTRLRRNGYVVGQQMLRANRIPTVAKLSTPGIIGHGRPLVLNCNAELVGLPSNVISIDQLELFMYPHLEHKETLVACYSPFNPLMENKSATYIPLYRDWKFKFSGAPTVKKTTMNSRAMNIQWTLNDARPQDAGIYLCKVHFIEQKLTSYDYVIGEQVIRGCPRYFQLNAANGKCYWLSTHSRRFGDANEYCEVHGKRGGGLASIQSSSEQKFLQKLKGKRWASIGLNRMIAVWNHWWAPADVGWIWEADGSQLGYSNWNKGSPKQRGSALDCVVMQRSGRWASVKCDTPRQFICQGTPTLIHEFVDYTPKPVAPCLMCPYDKNWIDN